LFPTPLRPEQRKATVDNHEPNRMRLQIRTSADPETPELVACERLPPRPGQIEAAVSAFGINFADALVAFSPCAAAPRRRLHRVCADHGHTVVGCLRRAHPVRRSFPFHGSERSWHKQTACRAQRAAPRRVAHLAVASDLRAVSLILRRSIDPDHPLSDYGMDSLGALELRTRIETETEIPINPTALANHWHHSRFGGAAVRKAAARGSRLTSACRLSLNPCCVLHVGLD
jgi:acyl carrier protein